MLTSAWRFGLQRWLNKYLVIDTWELRNPTEYNKTNGFIPPLQNVHNNTDQIGSCTANQDIYITTRYRGDLLYDQLPLGQLEQAYTMVGHNFIKSYADIAPLLDFQMIPVADCIQVNEYGDNLGDWLVTMVFSMNITWLPTLTYLPGDTTTAKIEPVRIDIGLFTEKVGSKDHRLPANRDKFGTEQVTKK